MKSKIPMDINKQTIEILKKYFVFDEVFYLSKYDLNMRNLYIDLEKYKKDYYQPNYRFIFCHYETEYYFNKNYPGLTLLNLQKILSNLNISNYFCLVLSQQDISNYLKFLQKNETTDLTCIDSVKYQNYYWTNEYLSPKKNLNVKISPELISKKYLCLNKISRFHRRVLFSLLKAYDLLDDGIISYLAKEGCNELNSLNVYNNEKNDKNLCLIETSTATRINDRWLLYNENIKRYLNDVPTNYYFKNFHETNFDGSTNKLIDFSLEQQCFLHVVTQTVYNYPSSYLNEKQLHPILCKRPFLSVGPPGSIQNLKDTGFRTFDQWWDESYDQIEDNEQRLIAITKIIKNICSMDLSSLRDICNNMQDVLEYNFNFYINHFETNEINKLEKFCRCNLLPRYD